MTHSPKTVRIHNVDPGGSQISLHLAVSAPKTAPRLRRGVSLLPVVIPAGRYYDVCKELGVDLAEAKGIIEASHEVSHHKRANRVLIREFPPGDAEKAADERRAAEFADAKAKTAALNPPDPPGAIPAGIDPVAVGLPPDTPKRTFSPLDAPVKAATMSRAEEPAEPEPVEAPKAAEAAPARSKEPSMDWSLDDLQAFAAERNIDVSGAPSKTAVLKKIRKGMST